MQYLIKNNTFFPAQFVKFKPNKTETGSLILNSLFSQHTLI